ncbi:glycosyltransferase [Vibrio alginolyticus]|uniref:glycosyltransferase n=1 Tax=Vibrio alginolyticus TaxID=663 RepID=UPI0021CFC632
MIDFSIIIPTYKDNKRLNQCLNSILNNDFEGVNIEVVVCDNDPDKSCFIDENKNKNINVKLVYQEKPGSYAARNKAVNISVGKYLVFTDSDCELSKQSLMEVFDMIKRDDSCIYGGDILLNGKSWISSYDVLFGIPNKYYIEKLGFSVTAGLCVSRDNFTKVGGFNDCLTSGGDRDFCDRLLFEGVKVVYLPKFIVLHPARDSFSEILRKESRLAFGVVQKYRNNLLKSAVVINDFLPPLGLWKAGLYQNRNLSKLRKSIAIVMSISIKFYRTFEKIRFFFNKNIIENRG